MSDNSSPQVSVIIPVFNDSKRLATCLQALEKQGYPSDRYEVIVVDNGSSEDIGAVVTRFAKARMIHEDQPGSYAARNSGIKHAVGDVLAFTDSDCIPETDWIENGVARLLSVQNCGLIGGRVKIFVREEAKPTLVERYESVMAFEQEYYIEQRHYSVTANLFTFRQVIETVGPFNTTIKSGGDRELGQRIYAHGYAQAYAEDVCVAHPARRSLRQLYSRHIRIAGGLYDKKRRSFGHSLAGLVWNCLPPLGKCVQIVRDPRVKGIRSKAEFIFIAFFTKYSMALERFRLTFGARSQRV